MPQWLQVTLDKHVESIPVVPGTKRSVSSYACNAILAQLKADGAKVYTVAEVTQDTAPTTP